MKEGVVCLKYDRRLRPLRIDNPVKDEEVKPLFPERVMFRSGNRVSEDLPYLDHRYIVGIRSWFGF